MNNLLEINTNQQEIIFNFGGFYNSNHLTLIESNLEASIDNIDNDKIKEFKEIELFDFDAFDFDAFDTDAFGVFNLDFGINNVDNDCKNFEEGLVLVILL